MKLLSMILACMLVFSGSACAEKYVYWTGTIDDGDIFGDATESGLHAWDYETDTHTFLGVDAHPVESDVVEGILAVNYGKESEFPREIAVYHCCDAKVAETREITLPDTVDTVYAIKDGWVYYSYVVIGDVPADDLERMRRRSDWLEYAEEFGVRRYHVKDQIIQDYVLVPEVNSAIDLPRISVGRDGEIAFEMPSGNIDWFFPEEDAGLLLYTAKPGEQPIVIKETRSLTINSNDYVPLWMDDGRLLYMNPIADEFWVYDGVSHERISAVEMDMPYYEHCVDRNGQYFASHIVAPERVWGEVTFFRLKMTSLIDGSTVRESETWVWNDDGLQFGD